MNAEKTITLNELKLVLANQLDNEKKMGADEDMLKTLETIFADIEHLASGRFIVNGIRI